MTRFLFFIHFRLPDFLSIADQISTEIDEFLGSGEVSKSDVSFSSGKSIDGTSLLSNISVGRDFIVNAGNKNYADVETNHGSLNDGFTKDQVNMNDTKLQGIKEFLRKFILADRSHSGDRYVERKDIHVD